MPCPKCITKHANVRLEQWTHGGSCKGRLFIDENAIVHCEKCAKTAHISRMRITCDSQKHQKEFMNKTEIASALAIGNIGVINNAMYWFKYILNHI